MAIIWRLAPDRRYILLQRLIIVFPVANTALPPDPFSFCIDAFNGGTPWHKGFCHEESIEAIAPVEGLRGIDGLRGGYAAVHTCIGRVGTNGLVRVELVEDGFAPHKGHGGRFIRMPVLI
jgi:hypothetical protein